MEHVEIKSRGGQHTLTADRGYILRSRKTGSEFRSVVTCDLRRWDVVACKDDSATKRARKRSSGGSPAHVSG